MYANTVAVVAALATVASANNMPYARRGHYDGHYDNKNETVVTTTKVVEEFTTYCPEPTTFTVNGKVYEVEEPTTITIEECPCTVVEPCFTCPPSKPTKMPAPPKGEAPAPPKGESPAPPKGEAPAPPSGGEGEAPAPPAGGEETPSAPEPTVSLPPVSGADMKSEFGVFALIGAAVAGMLAL